MFVSLQGSFGTKKDSSSPTHINGLVTPSPRFTSSPTLERLAFDYHNNLAEQKRKYEVVKKTLFWAVEKGFDAGFCSELWKKSQQYSPTPFEAQDLKSDIKKYYFTHSPKILNLKEQINNGATPASKRALLQRELSSLRIDWLENLPCEELRK